MKTITENTVQAGQGRMNIKEIARVAGVSPANYHIPCTKWFGICERRDKEKGNGGS